jgi:hypothetical protein
LKEKLAINPMEDLDTNKRRNAFNLTPLHDLLISLIIRCDKYHFSAPRPICISNELHDIRASTFIEVSGHVILERYEVVDLVVCYPIM